MTLWNPVFSGKTLAQFGLAIGALVFAISASAQYVWLDDKGGKQYSDQPPPSSVPKKNILKAPGLRKNTDDAAANADTAAPTPPAAASKTSAPMTTAERNADFQKRKAEQAEKEKKAAEESQNNANKKRDCERLRAYKRTLESGTPITRTDTNGERAFLDEKQLAQELKDTNKYLEGCN